MKTLTLNTSNFKEILKRAKTVKPKKAIKPILQCLFIKENNQVMVTDYYTTVIYTPSIINSEGNGIFAVNIDSLYKIVSKIKQDEFCIQLDNKAVITYGKINITLPLSDADDYPDTCLLQDAKNILNFNIEVKELKKMLQNVLFTACKDEMTKNLNGVLFEFSNNYFKMVTADSYRMSLTEKNMPGIDINKQMFMPLNSLIELNKNLKYIKKEFVTLQVYENYINIELQEKCDYLLQMKCNDINFPNYNAVIPNSFETQITVNRLELLEIVIAVGELTKKVGDTFKFDITQNKIQIKTNILDVGSFDATINGDINGKDLLCAFDSAYIIESLKHFASKNIILSFVDASNALQLTTYEDKDYLQIVMPVKIKQ